jgi:Fe2+ or Zn2+ uptake regulation protein
MSEKKTAELLRAYGIQPSAQRIAIAEYVLNTDSHPGADQVWTRVREKIPMVSRATVYNTLNLLVKKGLLRNYHLADGGSVFDATTERHHHFLDEESGRVEDIPWGALNVEGLDSMGDIEVTEYMVFVRGRKRKSKK